MTLPSTTTSPSSVFHETGLPRFQSDSRWNCGPPLENSPAHAEVCFRPVSTCQTLGGGALISIVLSTNSFAILLPPFLSRHRTRKHTDIHNSPPPSGESNAPPRCFRLHDRGTSCLDNPLMG